MGVDNADPNADADADTDKGADCEGGIGVATDDINGDTDGEADGGEEEENFVERAAKKPFFFTATGFTFRLPLR